MAYGEPERSGAGVGVEDAEASEGPVSPPQLAGIQMPNKPQ